jgi:hypothetical protein
MEEREPERRSVKRALKELELDAWFFEYDAGAQPEPPEQTFHSALERSDLYIGIFAAKLGAYTLDEYKSSGRVTV